MGPQLLALAAPAFVMGYAFFGFVIDDRHDIGGLKAGSYRIDATAMGCVKQGVDVNVSGNVDGLLIEMERE